MFYRLPQPVRRRLVRLATPTFTVGAVVILRDREAADPGRLLLVRQPGNRGWSLPAGLLARGETPVAGAVRELAEESGVRLAPEQLEQAVPAAVVHHHGRWVDIVFTGTVPASTHPLRPDGVEVHEAAWHPVDELPPLTRSTARLLGRYGIGPLAGAYDATGAPLPGGAA